MSENDSKPLMTEEVIRQEFKEINLQREVRFPNKGGTHQVPALNYDTVFAPEEKGQRHEAPIGLCFSGGGIRSATLNLGLLQGMRENGLLKHLDYLSTVSGGGYIGSWYTATNHRLAQKAATDPAAKSLLENHQYLDERNAAGSPFIHHLRKFSRYLAPQAGITSGDTWTMVSIWLRNTTLIQTLVISCISSLVCLFAALPVVFRAIVDRAVPPSSAGALFGSGGLWWLGMVVVQIVCIYKIVSLCQDGIACVQEGSMDAKRSGNQAARCGLKLSGWLMLGSFLASVQLYRMKVSGYEVFGDWVTALLVLVVSLLSVGMAWDSLRPAARARGRKHAMRFWAFGTLFQFATGICLVHGVWSLLGMLGAEGEAGLKNAFALSWSSILGVFLIMLGYSLIIVLAIGIIGRRMDEKMREWWGRVGAWVLMGGTLILLASVVSIAGPQLVDWLFLEEGIRSYLGSSVVIGWVLTLVLGVLAGSSSQTSKSGKGGLMELLAANLPLLSLIGLLVALSWVVRWKLMLPGSWGSGFLVESYSIDQETTFFVNGLWLGIPLVILGGIFIRCLDLNEFSMNPFYRNRLVRCYLGGSRWESERTPQPVTGFDFADDLPMSQLTTATAPSFGGPFQIVNTALNTGASAGNDVQDRSAESFIFTPLHAGFDFWRRALGTNKKGTEAEKRARYHPAASYTWKNGGWTLGTALSVSGAAASPNSGYHTSPLVAFMLTLFNARLGWWAPHPRMKPAVMTVAAPDETALATTSEETPKAKAAREKAEAKAAKIKAAREMAESDNDQIRPARMGYIGCLLNELTGSASINSDFVYLSDGGHFENLGLYELVRRRCGVIIVGDGECDPTYTFQALGMAIRRCRVDFGVEIKIDPSLIRPDPITGLSRSHVAIGSIHYDTDGKKDDGSVVKGFEGVLIYIKSSVTGCESRDVQQYHAENALFPHEPTGDQFFSEAQFESYRRLGLGIAQNVFRPATHVDLLKAASFDDYIRNLRLYWAPPPTLKVTSFVNHANTLLDIWKQAAASDKARDLDALLTSGCDGICKTPSPTSLPAPEQRYIIQQMLQLMENVFLDLDLAHHAEAGDNVGWMNLFKIWKADIRVCQVWEATRCTYGERFQTFWDQQVK